MTDLIQRLRTWAGWCHVQNIKAEVQAVMYEAADELERISSVLVDKDREIERLTREIASAGSIAAVNARQCEIITRLTRERDEAIKYRDYEFALRDALANENARLRAALKRIIHEHEHESFDAATTVARMYYVAREAFKGEK